MAKQKTKNTQRQPATLHGGRVSHVAENYLLSLYILREEGDPITLTNLAEYVKKLPPGEGLGTSLPSIAGMVRRMARDGLVVTTANRELQLTDKGLELAEDMVRRHRLAERLVVDILGIELHRAHIEAHRLEHAISPEMQARIVHLLGNPKTCPFGRPIPGSGHSYDTSSIIRLDEGRSGGTYVVERVPEEDEELLRFLVENQVIPERRVTIRETAPYLGVINFITQDSKEVSIATNVASRIWVRPLNKG